MEDRNLNNPENVLWIGLESYDERYSSIFFGRNEEIAQLTNAIYNNISTVIYGPSGTGKTSIIRAGVFHNARAKRYAPVYVRLNHDTKAENARTYTQQIIDAICEELSAREIDREQVLPYVDGERCQSLWEFFRCNEFWSADNYPVTPLLVLDQFEEIFTLGKNQKIQEDFFEQLSDLLDNKYPQYIRRYLSSRSNTHIVYPDSINFRCVLSMREDFLPRLEEHAESIPALKRNRFSLQCINEEQALDIIMKPQPGLVSEEVAVQIIEKVTNKRYKVDFTLHDQPDIEVEPSILSLFCGELDKKRRDRGMDEITIDLINEFGDNIIKDFYLSTISGLSPDKVEYLEARLLTADGFRDAVALGNAYKAGFSDEEIEYLTKNRLVRIDEWDGAKRMELTHDVLCKVAMAHRVEREEQKRREELERKQEEEKKRIIAQEHAKRQEIERLAAIEKERIKRRNRRWLAALSVMIALLVVGVIGYYFATTYEVVSYYESYTQRWGWPEGVGEKLSGAEREKTPLYYRLSHKGLLNKFDTEVQVCSSNPRLPLGGRLPNPYVDPDSQNDPLASAFLEKLNKVKTIRFDGDGRTLNREMYLDEDDQPLFAVNYFYVDDGKGAVRMFVDPQGLSMPIKGANNMLDRVKLSWDDEGRLKSMRFFNEKDVCVAGADSISGYRMLYPADDTKITYLLDEFGRPRQGEYNAVITQTTPTGKVTIYAIGQSANDSLPQETNGPSGYSRIVDSGDQQGYFVAGNDMVAATKTYEYDKRGNITATEIKGQINAKMLAKTKYAYDDLTGYLILEEFFDAEGRPFAQYTDSVYRRERAYTDGQLTSEIYTAVDGAIPYKYTLTKDNDRTVQCWTDANVPHGYLTRIDSLRSDGLKSVSYYVANDKPVNMALYEGEDSIIYHRKVYLDNDTLADSRYYIVNKEDQVVPNGSEEGIGEYFRKIERFDQDRHLLSIQKQNAQGEILRSIMYIVQDGQTVGRAAMGIDGTPVRCPDWEMEGFGYYVLYFTKDRNDVFSRIIPVNEQGAYSVLYDPWDGKYYNIVPLNYKGLTVTKKDRSTARINGDYIQNEFVAAQGISNLSLAFLHMLSHDSGLYKAGLRDGDRILALGSWKYDMDASLLDREWRKIYEGTPMKIKVLRPVGKTWTVKECEISADYDTPMEHYHMLRLTDTEKQDFIKAMNENQ